jgi:hypothetical protein
MISVDIPLCKIIADVNDVAIKYPGYISQFPNLNDLVYYPGPNPPSLWTRAYTDCVNCQNQYCGTNPKNVYPPPVCDCPENSLYITPEQLDMRRKAEIFKYKKNSANLTKQQKYSMAVTGNGPSRKKCWAAQSEYYTNPNVNNLPLNNDILTCGNDSPLAQKIANCSPSTNNNVPGPIINICYDKTIPLTNYITRRIYTFNGTKWPQTAWKPGDNGFPVGKAGTNKRFTM